MMGRGSTVTIPVQGNVVFASFHKTQSCGFSKASVAVESHIAL